MNHTNNQPNLPSERSERFGSIDAVRGLALLGILVMNIPTFALSAYAFLNPPLDGGFTGPDFAAWLGSHLFFEMKMMTLFSMLFGAGVGLYLESRKARWGLWPAVGAQSRRLGWLLVFGLIHAYLIWEGDILVYYALCGFLVILLHALRPAWLFVIGGLLLTVGALSNFAFGSLFAMMRDAYEMQNAGETLAPWQEDLAQSYEETRTGFEPTPEMLDDERAAFEGSYMDLLRGHRLQEAFFMQVFVFPTLLFWRVGGAMLIGLALHKLGFWRGEWSRRAYGVTLAVGGVLGFAIVGLGAQRLLDSDFDFVDMFRYNWNFNYFGSFGVALAWASLVILLVKGNALKPVTAALRAVGRLAFTNYIMQSLLCAAIFYGYAGGLWGELSRWQLLIVVALIWTVQIAFSLLWLRSFRIGPLEWLWRSLVSWRLEPIRKA